MIEKITIVHLPGRVDTVYLLTDKPTPFPHYAECLVLQFEASPGKGKAYVEENFPGIPYEVVP